MVKLTLRKIFDIDNILVVKEYMILLLYTIYDRPKNRHTIFRNALHYNPNFGGHI